jgi:hypothetical protein
MTKLLLIAVALLLMATVYAMSSVQAGHSVWAERTTPRSILNVNHAKEAEHDLIDMDDPLGEEMDRFMDNIDRLIEE